MFQDRVRQNSTQNQIRLALCRQCRHHQSTSPISRQQLVDSHQIVTRATGPRSTAILAGCRRIPRTLQLHLIIYQRSFDHFCRSVIDIHATVFCRLPSLSLSTTPRSLIHSTTHWLLVQGYSSLSLLALRRNIQRLIQSKSTCNSTLATQVHSIPWCFVQIHVNTINTTWQNHSGDLALRLIRRPGTAHSVATWLTHSATWLSSSFSPLVQLIRPDNE